MTLLFKNIATNGISLHTALSGQEDGDPVILLHGFPEAWFGWEAQIRPLVDSGFRVIVPDQRGYNLSSKPKGIGNYQMKLLAADIIGLADALGYQRFHLAGHDFGAMVSWHLAIHYPERIKRLVIANVPHPAVMRNYLKTHPSQMLKSWYVFFFQIARLPEFVIRIKNWHLLISTMPDDFTEKERDRYRDAWDQPGAITGMLNWYRAMLRRSRRSTLSSKVRVPTLVLWGQQDAYISYEMAALSVDQCEQGRLVTFKGATHWVLHDKPEGVSQKLIEHFTGWDEK